VKITDRYAEEAQKYGCKQVVQRFKREVEGHLTYEHNQRDVYGFGEYLRKEHKNFRSIYIFKQFDINGEDIRCYVVSKGSRTRRMVGRPRSCQILSCS
jgi:hypothetical protein